MPELSMLLQSALVGEAPMSQALMSEWQSKRPADYLAHKKGAIERALNDIGCPTKSRHTDDSQPNLLCPTVLTVASHYYAVGGS